MSIFEWNTGKPSIFGKLQKDAAIAKKSSDNLSARLNTKPVPIKPKRNSNGKTKPLAFRLDFDAVRDYRLSGKSWPETARHFGCCVRAIHIRACEMFPELRTFVFDGDKPRGKKPKPLPMGHIIQQLLDGESLRGVARLTGIAHSTLHHRLMQSEEGAAALAVARERADNTKRPK